MKFVLQISTEIVGVTNYIPSNRKKTRQVTFYCHQSITLEILSKIILLLSIHPQNKIIWVSCLKNILQLVSLYEQNCKLSNSFYISQSVHTSGIMTLPVEWRWTKLVLCLLCFLHTMNPFMLMDQFDHVMLPVTCYYRLVPF